MREVFSVKEPSLAHITVDHDVGIIMMNPAGSSCHEDTGREAQELADRLGIVVIAADRPTGRRWLPDPAAVHLLGDNPIKAIDGLAKKIDKEIDHYGFNSVSLVGRSAAATSVMELALTGRIATAESMYAAEPAGCENVGAQRSAQEYKTRVKADIELKKADEAQAAISGELKLIHPLQDYKSLSMWRQLHRYATMPFLMATDVRYNRDHYNHEIVPDYLGRVVFDLGIRTHVDFAEHSMVLPSDEEQLSSLIDRLNVIQMMANGQFSFARHPNTMHQSFDRREFFAERIQETILAA